MVIIENQISPIANRMKNNTGNAITVFFNENNTLDIEFISSMNKLKDDEIHDTYSERKKLVLRNV